MSAPHSPDCKLPSDFVQVCSGAATNFNNLKNRYNDKVTSLYTDYQTAITNCTSAAMKNDPGYADAINYINANPICPLTCNFPPDMSKPPNMTPDCQKCWDSYQLKFKVNDTCNTSAQKSLNISSDEYQILSQAYVDYNYTGWMPTTDYVNTCTSMANKNSCSYNSILYSHFQPWNQVNCSGYPGCDNLGNVSDGFGKCMLEQYCTVHKDNLSDTMKQVCGSKP